ncbi:MAG: hypothetical protein COB07_12205 [Sulfurovum sp.]|nr:MAG: hypothetical protein COB07_12205 [Sulfurovum sp.]
MTELSIEKVLVTAIISKYLSESKLDTSNSSNIGLGMTDELIFRDINFDDFFKWDEENALKVGSENIDLIIDSGKRISTYLRLAKLKNFKPLLNNSILFHKYLNFKYPFTQIKQITFNDCKFSYG